MHVNTTTDIDKLEQRCTVSNCDPMVHKNSYGWYFCELNLANGAISNLQGFLQSRLKDIPLLEREKMRLGLQLRINNGTC